MKKMYLVLALMTLAGCGPAPEGSQTSTESPITVSGPVPSALPAVTGASGVSGITGATAASGPVQESECTAEPTKEGIKVSCPYGYSITVPISHKCSHDD